MTAMILNLIARLKRIWDPNPREGVDADQHRFWAQHKKEYFDR